MNKKIMYIIYIVFFSLGVVSINDVKADANNSSNTTNNMMVDNSSNQVIDSKSEDNKFSTQETNKKIVSDYNYPANNSEKVNEGVTEVQNNLTDIRANLFVKNSNNINNGWVSRYGSWYYYDDYGNSYSNGWHVVDNNWYYFSYDGRMASNEIIKTGHIKLIKMDIM